MPKLLIQEGGQQSVFELFDDEVTIGRGAANVIQVADPRSSKHHAVVRRLHGRPKLIDFESRNGTRVNGEFRNQRWLEHGDVVSIGEMTMTYDASDVPAAAAAPGIPSAPVAVAAAPRAVAVHVKTAGYDPSGWQRRLGRDGQPQDFDLRQCLAIVKAAGFQGPLNFEYNMAEEDERVGISKGIAYLREVLATV